MLPRDRKVWRQHEHTTNMLNMDTRLLLLLVTIMLSACTKEQDEIRHTTTEITFNLTPRAGISRAGGRDPNTYENLQWVTDMRVYAFKKQSDGTYLYTKVSVDENGTEKEYYPVDWVKGTGSQTYRIISKLEEKATYMFLAVGLDDGKLNFKDLDFTGKTLTEASICLKDNARCREVFAGKTTHEVTIVANTGFNIPIELKRTVAGVRGYFKNIPATYNGQEVKSVKVTLHQKKNTRQILSSPKTTDIEALSDNTILDIPLPGVGQNQEVVVGGNKVMVDVSIVNNIYRFAYRGWPAGEDVLKIQDHTVLSSAFLMPAKAPGGPADNTLRIELCNAGGEMLKYWIVYIDIQQAGDETDLSKYSILPNHYYALGDKAQLGNDDVNDKPIDLSKDHEVVITVNPDWECIHDMEITPPTTPPAS